jgi:hypothetical protein
MSGKHHKTPWWRRLGRRPQGEKPRRLLTEMVDGAGLAHWVSREAFEQGLREGTGRCCSIMLPPERGAPGGQRRHCHKSTHKEIMAWHPPQSLS